MIGPLPESTQMMSLSTFAGAVVAEAGTEGAMGLPPHAEAKIELRTNNEQKNTLFIRLLSRLEFYNTLYCLLQVIPHKQTECLSSLRKFDILFSIGPVAHLVE